MSSNVLRDICYSSLHIMPHTHTHTHIHQPLTHTHHHHHTHTQWSTVLFEGPVLKLYELFEDIFVKMKGSTTQGPAETGSEPQVSIPASSPALPIISAIRLRLLLLKPEEKLHRLELGGTLEPDDVKLMFCEAMRRLSLQKWPHKDYV